MAIILFDLDGTLLINPSSEQRFIIYLLKKRCLTWRQFLAWLKFIIRHFWQYKKQIFRKNKAYLCGLSVTKIEKMAENFIQEQLLPNFHHSVYERLKQHQAANDIVILLTGAPDFIALPLANHLKFNYCCATQLSKNNDVFTDQPLLEHPFQDDKVKIATRLCQTLNCELSTTIAYADSIHDLPLLQQVKQAIVVNPNAKLRGIAQIKHWEII